MAWTLTDDVGTYLATVEELLRSDPVRSTVMLTVLANLSRRGPMAFGETLPVLGWWSPDGVPRAAMLQTPPRPLLTTGLPGDSAQQLARELAGRGIGLSGVNGGEADATALEAAWHAITGIAGRTRQRQWLYRLDALVQPDPSPDGAARIATAADTAVIGPWFAAFTAEIGEPEAAGALVIDRLDRGQLMLWELGGEPVSLAGHTDVIASVARVGPVYTPPDLRGRGYAGGVTAAVTELAISRGAKSVILFTDLANPTSNSLYRRLGYEPVEDRVVLVFGD
jgi:predicted GNAT family acetyltransferase